MDANETKKPAEKPSIPVETHKPDPQIVPSEKAKAKHKRLYVYLAVAAVLIVGGGVAAWLLMQPNKSVMSTQKPAEQKTSYSVLLTVHESNSSTFKVLASDGTLKPYGTFTASFPYVVKRPDGSLRLMGETHTESPSKYTYAIGYEDEDGTKATIYTINSPKQGPGGTNGFRWVANNSGSKIAVYERIITTDSRIREELSLVDDKGVKQTLLTRHEEADPAWYPGYTGVLVPFAFSSDDAILYLADYSCIECDGPPRPALFALDTKTKKLTKEVTVASAQLNAGSWTKLKNDTFILSTQTLHGLELPNYEQALSDKNAIYLYSTATKKLQVIFQNKGVDPYSADIVGISDDKKTIYVRQMSLLKYSGKAYSMPSEGSAYTYQGVGVYAISVVDGSISKVNLPDISEGLWVTDVKSYKGDIFYQVGVMGQPFSNSQYDPTHHQYVLEQGQKSARLIKELDALNYAIVGFVDD